MFRSPALMLTPLFLCLVSGAAAAESRRMAIAYEVTIGGLPPGVGPVEIFVPLPAEDEDQALETYRVRSDLAGVVERDSVYGNRFWRVSLPTSPASSEGSISITLEATIERQVDSHAVPASARALSDAERTEFALFLKANEHVVVGDEILDPILAEVRALAGSEDKAALARAIYDWVVDNVEYRKDGTGWGNGDTFWACNERYGNCTDFHALFISLARTLGIPARFEMGFPVPMDRDRGEIAGYHCWVEFYLPGAGWLPIDASEASKHPEMRELLYGTHPADRVQFTTGRDLRLGEHHADPRPLNYFIYPYVEVAGKRFEGKIAWKVTYADLKNVETFGP